MIGGYDLVDDLHWTVIAQEPASILLAPVTSQRQRAILIVTLGALLAVGVSIALAWRTTRPIRRLTDVARTVTQGDLSARVSPEGSSELVMLGESFNAMLATCHRLIDQVNTAGIEVNSAAAELSASSDELAATTTQQSAAVTQATATTEELARSSAAIADTVDEVARQTARDPRQPRTGRSRHHPVQRTHPGPGQPRQRHRRPTRPDQRHRRPDQPARPQRRHRSRPRRRERTRASPWWPTRSAAWPNAPRPPPETSPRSWPAVQGETNATVMAMEKGAKQMQQGLMLLEAVTDANGQVRLTTQQQRSATAQVVETMEQLTDASRQVSATAQQIAAAAGNLADLAGNLETTAATASGNGHG